MSDKPPEFCPLCVSDDPLKLDQERPAVNPVSRQTGDYVCKVCGHAEAVMDMAGITFKMAYVAMRQYYEEAIRLPPGGMWPPETPFQFPTGGLHEVHSDPSGQDNGC